MTRAARSRAAFIRTVRGQFGVTAKVAREMARRYRERTGDTPTAKAVRQHPRITAKLVRPSKAAITRKERAKVAAKAKVPPRAIPVAPVVTGVPGVPGIPGGVAAVAPTAARPVREEIPEEFYEGEDMLFGYEEFGEEVEY